MAAQHALVMVAALWCTALGHAADLSAGDLTIRLDDQANIVAITAGKRQLRTAPAPLVALSAVSDGVFRAPAIEAGGLESALALRFTEARVTATLTAVARNGKASLRLENPTTTDTTVSQTVLLNQTRPCPILARATVYWSLDAGVPRTSQEVGLQVPDGDGWTTLTTATPERPVPQTTLRLREPFAARRFRIFQPTGRGPKGREGLMWVREVELIEAER